MSQDLDRRRLLCGGCAAMTLAACGGNPGVDPQAGTTGETGGTNPGTLPGTITDPLDNPNYPCDQPIDPGAPGWTAIQLSQHPELETVGGWLPTQANGKIIIVAHVQQGCYVAVERRCTHRGTLIDYDPARGQFVCSAHASIFDWEGFVVGGPAPAPIAVYLCGREGDTIWVRGPDAA